MVELNNDGSPPSFLQGEFEDDYGIKYSIDQNEWLQLPHAQYHILKWAISDQYLIARNDEANPGEAGLWTRIDWVEFSEMPPFEWGFCVSAYDAVLGRSSESRRHRKAGRAQDGLQRPSILSDASDRRSVTLPELGRMMRLMTNAPGARRSPVGACSSLPAIHLSPGQQRQLLPAIRDQRLRDPIGSHRTRVKQ